MDELTQSRETLGPIKVEALAYTEQNSTTPPHDNQDAIFLLQQIGIEKLEGSSRYQVVAMVIDGVSMGNHWISYQEQTGLLASESIAKRSGTLSFENPAPIQFPLNPQDKEITSFHQIEEWIMAHFSNSPAVLHLLFRPDDPDNAPYINADNLKSFFYVISSHGNAMDFLREKGIVTGDKADITKMLEYFFKDDGKYYCALKALQLLFENVRLELRDKLLAAAQRHIPNGKILKDPQLVLLGAATVGFLLLDRDTQNAYLINIGDCRSITEDGIVSAHDSDEYGLVSSDLGLAIFAKDSADGVLLYDVPMQVDRIFVREVDIAQLINKVLLLTTDGALPPATEAKIGAIINNWRSSGGNLNDLIKSIIANAKETSVDDKTVIALSFTN